MFAITKVSLKDLSKVIREIKYFPCEGYMRKRSKQMPNDCYLYLTRQLEPCIMRNSRGPVRTQNMRTQRMSNYKMSTQNIPKFHVFSTDKS